MPSPLAFLAVLLPADALMGGAATSPLVLVAAAFCLIRTMLPPFDPDAEDTPCRRQAAQAAAQHLRCPTSALADGAGAVAAFLLAPPWAAFLLLVGALVLLDAQLRLAAHAIRSPRV